MSSAPQGCDDRTNKPSPEMVRKELDRILSSPIFSKSARLTTFLQYVVEQALVGNSTTLKESVLALELYNRNSDFDTRLDPIVRVDARRLRDKLREFYAEAPNETVIISLPKGGYLPTFTAGNGRQTLTEGATPTHEPKPASDAPRLLRPIVWIAGGVALTIVLVAFFHPLLFTSEVVSELRPVASLPGSEGRPSLSPDGNFIAFAWSGPPDKPDPGIYIKAVDSDGLRRLTSGYGPAWSPDGRDIAFLGGGSDGGVFVISQLGGPERRVAASATDVGWLPNSETLICREKDPTAPEKYALFSISLTTLENRQLTHAPAGSNDWRFAASPDGKTLAFVRYGLAGIGDIYLMPLAGGVPRRLTAWNGSFGGLTWTPDGREIVFSVEEMAGSRLWRVSAEASSPNRGVRLAESTGNAEAPVIARSNSGRSVRLAYLETREQIGLRLIDLTSPHPFGVLDAGRAFQRSSRVDIQGQISPKADRVAFLSNRTGPAEIWISALDGSALRRLTYLNAPGTNFPAWSPDGQMITFISSAGGNGTKSVFVVDATGGSSRQITEPSTVGPPWWSGDGSWIYFMSNRSGAYQIWRTTPSGARPAQITRNGGFEVQESPDGKCLYYADQPPRGTSGLDAPVKLMRVPVDGGKEIVVLRQIWALHWSVTKDGIFYLSPGPPKALLFYRFASESAEFVGNLPDQSIPLVGTTTVSHDGRWLMISEVDFEDTDLMLIDNFR